MRMVATEQIICRCFVNTIFACGCTRVVLTGNGGCRSCAADRRASNAQCNHPPGHPAAVSAHVWQCESAPPHAMVGASGVLSGCRCIWNAPPRSNLSCVAFVSLVPHPTIRVVLCWLVPCTWYGGRCSKMLACEDPFFFDTVVPIGPKNDMCHSQRPKVRSEPATCVNVPKIALMIHPGSTLTQPCTLDLSHAGMQRLTTLSRTHTLSLRRRRGVSPL